MVDSATVLIRERGVEATSFSDVVVASGAPRGSIYHYFPRGKAQLVEEATSRGADFIVESMSRALDGRDTVTALDVFAGWYYTLLREFDYAAGCPLLAAAIEGGRTPGASAEAADGFNRWERTIVEALIRDGADDQRATEIAALAVASMEGALAMCRAKRSAEPLDQVIAQLQTVIRDATGQRS